MLSKIALSLAPYSARAKDSHVKYDCLQLLRPIWRAQKTHMLSKIKFKSRFYSARTEDSHVK